MPGFSACCGDVTEDYREQEIENFMEELGVFDNEINFRDARWIGLYTIVEEAERLLKTEYHL